MTFKVSFVTRPIFLVGAGRSQFIHILRDGTDTARPCIGMRWAFNVWIGVRQWIEAENLWANSSKSLLKNPKIKLK